jgi:glutamate--cysteine ligase
MTDGHPAGWPTIEDYRYHLTTLFPPVRPRGWLELRVLDALPGWLRDAAVLTVAAACSIDASRELHRRLPDTGRLWLTAARYGLTHPQLASAARVLTQVVADNLGCVTSDARHAQIIEEFAARYVRAGRSPGHDVISQVRQFSDDRPPALAWAG